MSKVVVCPFCSSWDVKHIETTDSGKSEKAPISRIYQCKNCKNKFAERYDIKFVKIEKVNR